MKAIKAMKSMKGMKRSMKSMKRASQIAKGKRMRASVWLGNKVKTSTGHKKSDLMKNKRGKIVTRKSHAAGVKSYKGISKWTKCFVQARKALSITGFVPCGGRTAQGKALYAKAKSLFHQ